jgi:sulfate adenylyltransferase subunit 2
MIKFREKYVKEWGLNLIVGKNEQALSEGMEAGKGRFECCNALKTQALQNLIDEHGFKGRMLGIRRDEEGSRAKERVFSPRDENFEWNYTDQPPELWDQFQTEVTAKTHMRIHPLLHWTELNVWEYIKREDIPVIDLYFSKNGERYRSIGCHTCCEPVESTAETIDDVIEELKNTKVSERSGRKQDQEGSYNLQKLRFFGYM